MRRQGGRALRAIGSFQEARARSRRDVRNFRDSASIKRLISAIRRIVLTGPMARTYVVPEEGIEPTPAVKRTRF